VNDPRPFAIKWSGGSKIDAPDVGGRTTMTLVGMEIAGSAEEAVRRLLLGGVAASYRLATCILRDSSAAEDAVQEAALHAWSRRRELRDPERVEAWFSRIVVNVCRVELERRSRGALVHLAVPIDRPAPGDGPDSDAWAERDEVAAAIARLTPEEQIVVAMRYGRDLSVPQIAERTGLREGTVKSRLHNAGRHLRAALEAERRVEERP
jgi:RNA polymerase sigma-70 factor, ECF subfamily